MSDERSGGIPFERPLRLVELARSFGGELDEAARTAEVSRVVSPQDARDATDLIVVTSARGAALAAGRSGVALCDVSLGRRLPAERRWVHPHCWWVISRLVDSTGRAPSNAVDESADVHPTARLEPGAIVHAGASVGANSRIGAYAIVYPRVVLGAGVIVGAHSVIGRPGFGWTLGPDGNRVRVPQLGGVFVDDDAEIGPLCTVDAGTLSPTKIGSGVKLDAHVHVGHNVVLGSGTLVAAQAGFAGSVSVGRDVLIGGQSGIADHVNVGAGVRIAAKSGVIADIPDGAVVAGFPAVSRLRWLRAMATLLRQKVTS